MAPELANNRLARPDAYPAEREAKTGATDTIRTRDLCRRRAGSSKGERLRRSVGTLYWFRYRAFSYSNAAESSIKASQL
jgi:hypothetical protein